MMWQSFATWLRRCGRHGTLFIVALVLTPVVLGLMAFVGDLLGRFAGPFFHLLWLGASAVVLADFIRAWRHPPRLGKLPPLSQNELHAARSKLLKHRTTR
jgi:hypothetical protein